MTSLSTPKDTVHDLSGPEPVLFDHYSVERVLGHGAAGVVYLARDIRIGRHVALKTLGRALRVEDDDSDADAFIERFRREAELCGSLVHPNIVMLYEVGFRDQRITYMAMEYVEGESLLSLLRREGRLSVGQAFRVVDDILKGLSYAHERGIVHRDIKPGNILMNLEGQAKVADFGVARSLTEGRTQLTGFDQLIGTPHYMSPEHIAGHRIDSRADLFSVGVVLFELLTGQRPFEATSVMDVLYQIMNNPAPSVVSIAPDVPRWCVPFLERLLAKSPNDRFLSAAVASRELHRLMNVGHDTYGMPELEMTQIRVVRETPPEDTPTTPIERPAPKPVVFKIDRTIPSFIAFTILAVLVAGLIAGGIHFQRRLQSISDIPTPDVNPGDEQLEQRKDLLHEARILSQAGAHDASIERYQAYLALYPWSSVAQQALERVHQQKRDAQSEEARVVATATQPPRTKKQKTTRRASGPPIQSSTALAENEAASPDLTAAVAATEPSPPDPFWKRVRRFFRKDQPPPQQPQASPQQKQAEPPR